MPWTKEQYRAAIAARRAARLCLWCGAQLAADNGGTLCRRHLRLRAQRARDRRVAQRAAS